MPEPLVSAAPPTLGSTSQARAALRHVRERLARARRLPRTRLPQLARTAGWIAFLETWLRLAPTQDDAEKLGRIGKALALATNPVVRQDLIFLAALVLPLDVAEPWLRDVADGGAPFTPGDVEDALVALAFAGSPSAAAAFERRASEPATAKVRRIVDWPEDHEAIAKAGTSAARNVLRSYRAIEAFAREPYFKMTALLATHWASQRAGFGGMLGFTPAPRRTRREEIDLLEAWIERYPGHPGSDDVAAWIAGRYLAEDDLLDAARWYSRSAVLPDQDVAWSSIRLFAGLCEIDLRPEDVLLLADDEGLSTPNRAFLQYVWLRRLAAERGFEVAVGELEDFARREPDSDLSAAWRGRFQAAPPRGLDSGVRPLPGNDPLRRHDPGAVTWPNRKSPSAPRGYAGFHTHRWGSPEQRLHPWPEPVVLDHALLLAQFRAWVTLADLERRTRRARGAARADLLYKQAAVFYHDRNALYPVYGHHDIQFSGTLRSIRRTDEGETRGAPDGRARFESTTLSYVRAMDLFERLEREHPDYAAMDKVIFSEGLLWRRLVDYKPSSRFAVWRVSEGSSVIRRTAETFERLVARFPESPLATSAAAAAAWWRRARPQAFPR